MEWPEPLRVLSLFDGIGCGWQALANLGAPVAEAVAVERYHRARKVVAARFPWVRHEAGDVRRFKTGPPGRFDLVMGGSPCQEFSGAKHMGRSRPALRTDVFAGDKASLFEEFARILEAENPRWFLFENVGSMTREVRAAITARLGVEPVSLDAARWLAQRRVRWFWTNIPVPPLPEDRGVRVADILDDEGAGHAYDLNPAQIEYMLQDVAYRRKSRRRIDAGHAVDLSRDKAPTLVANVCRGLPYGVVWRPEHPRFLTWGEIHRLQGLPDDHTMVDGVTRYAGVRMTGNGWAVPVIEHILTGLCRKTTS